MTGEERFAEIVTALLADPECAGDLFAVGVWLARAVHLGRPAQLWKMRAIATDVFGYGRKTTTTFLGRTTDGSTGLTRVRETFRADVPRYDPFLDNPGGVGGCTAPMPRAARDRCGRSATVGGFLIDTSTGRWVAHAACRRHHAWHRARKQENQVEVDALGPHLPQPAANAGGVLARHLPEVNWPVLWRVVEPRWQPPAEGAPTRRPVLHVIADGDHPQDDDGDLPVPVLRLVRGGWDSSG